MKRDVVKALGAPRKGPREALIRVLKGVALGDFGHDLADSEFYCDADMIIARLASEGFVIGEAIGRQIELHFDTLIGPIRLDAGTYRMQRVARDPEEQPAF